MVPAALFLTAVSVSLWGLGRTQAEFDHYIGAEQAVASGLSELYAQGLQQGQALRNVVLDPSNRKAYDNLSAAQAAYAKAYEETLGAAKDSKFMAGLRELEPLRAAQAKQQERVLALVKTDMPAAVKVLNAEETPAWRQLRAQLMAQQEAARKSAAEAHEATVQRARQVLLIAVALAGCALMVSLALFWLLRRTVAAELGGDPADARTALRRIAEGDLTVESASGSTTGLMGTLQETRQRLSSLVREVRAATDSLNTASAEIAAGNLDLSVRTEHSASNLQQTASSMEELTATVAQTAQSARQASQLALSAADVASRGGSVMTEVVSTMNEIDSGSKRIAEIIGVIDGIAFQTNLLALNAAVEAARAGEQGRGFAVVAAEVRALAGRSANAAKQIKGLIQASVGQVEVGARLVIDAGRTMDEIVVSVQQVTHIIEEISAAASEQSQGVGQLNTSVTQLDQATQQNAALVEQSAAAAASLNEQSGRLAQLVSAFRV